MEFSEPDKLSGLAGLFGVLIGGATSIATTWITTTSERKLARIEAQTQFRKEIYASFMNELAAMYAHALKNESINYDLLANAYAVRGRITLASSDDVVAAADKALKFVVDLSMSDQKSDSQIRSMMDENEMDVIRDFATACRVELAAMR
jgi:hypothetical protein